mmetsp:Transcript_92579/g.215117  ORF Transcript_92579/g.215117 Transcript_92579/m.215117 type:complete len:230 (-) Transcript_92579:243-932(-)
MLLCLFHQVLPFLRCAPLYLCSGVLCSLDKSLPFLRLLLLHLCGGFGLAAPYALLSLRLRLLHRGVLLIGRILHELPLPVLSLLDLVKHLRRCLPHLLRLNPSALLVGLVHLLLRIGMFAGFLLFSRGSLVRLPGSLHRSRRCLGLLCGLCQRLLLVLEVLLRSLHLRRHRVQVALLQTCRRFALAVVLILLDAGAAFLATGRVLPTFPSTLCKGLVHLLRAFGDPGKT